ncbi:hypothetical protein ACP70R_010576 [Stipagrostis hirtigluma subsp. patula]
MCEQERGQAVLQLPPVAFKEQFGGKIESCGLVLSDVATSIAAPRDGRTRALDAALHQLSAPFAESYMDLNAATTSQTLYRKRPEERTLKTYKRRRVRRPTVPEVSDEIVFEILVWLPVKTLVQCKSVCKAWHAIISDPVFIRKHLQQSTKKHEQRPTFLIAPHILDKAIDSEAWPPTVCNNVPFYVWQEGKGSACLMHSTDFHGEFGSVYPMSHCDGLVILPTNTKVYVFNPATGGVLKLPDGHKYEGVFQTVGLGFDPHANKYKVVRFFYRSLDFSKMTYHTGMEVFTINGGDSCWRGTAVDPPYPLETQAPMHFKGSLYWHIDDQLLKRPVRGFLRFKLEDETFSFIRSPVSSDGDLLDLVELGDRLCLAQYLSDQIVIWMSPSGDDHGWDRRYIINLSEACYFRTLGMLNDGILIRKGNYLYRYDPTSKDAKEVVRLDHLRYKNPMAGSFDFVLEDLFFFNIIPYTESLVPLI